jgi:hypothetical protein
LKIKISKIIKFAFLRYETMSLEYSNTLDKIGYFFTSVFIAEAVLKLIGFG